MSLLTISPQVEQAALAAERVCSDAFARIHRICEKNTHKVLKAFIDNRVSATDFAGSSGYGYDDAGRDTLDKVVADAFGCEDALMRHNFISGTHTLTVALFGILRPGDTMLAVTGKPYDTMEEVIGLTGTPGDGSLKDFGIRFRAVDLTEDHKVNIPAVLEAMDDTTKMIYVQRSGGYDARPALLCEDIAAVAKAVKEKKPDVVVMVDNCYGEFTEEQEPVAVGADLMAGSLIKNAGGGLCRTGGYIAGRADLVKLCAYRLSVIGQGKEVGCTLNELRTMYQGFFLAPEVTAAAMKTATFTSALLRELGCTTFPEPTAKRGDIITVVHAGTREKMIAFVQGIQGASPVDAYAAPEPWAMPGYTDEIIMAAGTFTQGASVEISCDGPVRPPYACYLQGGITYFSGKAAVMSAAEQMLRAEKT